MANEEQLLSEGCVTTGACGSSPVLSNVMDGQSCDMHNDKAKRPDFKLSFECAVEVQSILNLASRTKYSPPGMVPPAHDTTELCPNLVSGN